MNNEPKVESLHYEKGKLDMRLSGPHAMNIMEIFVDLFEQNGGKNFLSMTLEAPGRGKKYDIVINNANGGMTAAEKLQAQEDELASLRSLLEELDKQESWKAISEMAQRESQQLREELERTRKIAKHHQDMRDSEADRLPNLIAELEQVKEQLAMADNDVQNLSIQLAEAVNILRDMDAHMDLSEPVPNGGSMGEFEDASGINQVFDRATNFLSRYKEVDK